LFFELYFLHCHGALGLGICPSSKSIESISSSPCLVFELRACFEEVNLDSNFIASAVFYTIIRYGSCRREPLLEPHQIGLEGALLELYQIAHLAGNVGLLIPCTFFSKPPCLWHLYN